jgi:Na+-translocating ferredoxin:NAD+ oxidoreductase RnfG subunit
MTRAPKTRPVPWLQGLLALGLICVGPRAQAERFLTAAEARRLCFPAADRFDEQVIRFTPEQVRAIEKACRLKVRNRGHRLWLAHAGTNLVGVLIADHVLGKHEVIDYAVAVSPDGRVLQIEVLEYRESYGGEIRGVRWRDQFRGKTGAAPLRLNDDIYNISGATISCRQVTEGVRRVLATFEQVVRPRLRAGDRGLSDTSLPAVR